MANLWFNKTKTHSFYNPIFIFAAKIENIMSNKSFSLLLFPQFVKSKVSKWPLDLWKIRNKFFSNQVREKRNRDSKGIVSTWLKSADKIFSMQYTYFSFSAMNHEQLLLLCVFLSNFISAHPVFRTRKPANFLFGGSYNNTTKLALSQRRYFHFGPVLKKCAKSLASPTSKPKKRVTKWFDTILGDGTKVKIGSENNPTFKVIFAWTVTCVITFHIKK